MIRQFVVCLFICLFGSVMTESDELENKSTGIGKFRVNHVIFSSLNGVICSLEKVDESEMIILSISHL